MEITLANGPLDLLEADALVTLCAEGVAPVGISDPRITELFEWEEFTG